MRIGKDTLSEPIPIPTALVGAFIRELSQRLSRASGFEREFLMEIIREVSAQGKKLTLALAT